MEKNYKTLILSDDTKLILEVQGALSLTGFCKFYINSVDTKISEILKVYPDIVILDSSYEKNSNINICDAIKGDFRTAHMPVIVLLEKDSQKDTILKLRHAPDDYLVKPADKTELITRIEISLKRTQHSVYSNPLTRLPGSIVVEDILKERIKANETFVVGHIDIDNFKSFNDGYGYTKGDRVIMQTAYMLSNSVSTYGNSNDFVGHIGGDDFVLITTPDKCSHICEDFICMFDTIIQFHYSPEDRKRGYVQAKDRTNILRKTPLMSMTIALVMKNSKREIKDIVKMNERLTEVKKYLKKIPGSKYMIDRRVKKKTDHLSVQIFKNDKSVIKNYKPLGQLLVDKKLLTQNQLDHALKTHWRRGAQLGEVLSDLGYLTGKQLKEALLTQEMYLEESMHP